MYIYSHTEDWPALHSFFQGFDSRAPLRTGSSLTSSLS